MPYIRLSHIDSLDGRTWVQQACPTAKPAHHDRSSIRAHVQCMPCQQLDTPSRLSNSAHTIHRLTMTGSCRRNYKASIRLDCTTTCQATVTSANAAENNDHSITVAAATVKPRHRQLDSTRRRANTPTHAAAHTAAGSNTSGATVNPTCTGDNPLFQNPVTKPKHCT